MATMLKNVIPACKQWCTKPTARALCQSPRRHFFGPPPRSLNDLFYSMRRIERDMERAFECYWPSFGGARYAVPWNTDKGVYQKIIQNEDGSQKLQLVFDVRNFKPGNIKVEAEGNKITVKASQEEPTSDGGRWFREFHREYTLPEGLNLEAMRSLIAEDGNLTIEAPYVDVDEKSGPTEIPIHRKNKK